ncbi:cytochrome-c peroxidase [Siphonobacter aquaeclarae]|uniref:Cytochrome c peroxidase n=1 Tax=Siphonobacter aquaeclarae TaxID=563176 RepID=A0A1G9MRY4_9BACT|nr:cytochrome c peroxidase [Siphonobacter aquaeclarae]SDL76415.1 cytochrome c peroxidase [Siphonobacter aquaeclarae]
MKNLATALFFLGLLSCSPGKDSPETKPFFYVPANFPQPEYPVASNPVTQAGFDLGKRLFYDGILSRDSTIACGECHRQYFAFTHHLHDLSHGIENRIGLRNSLSLQNLAWEKHYMWDGAVTDLYQQPIVPIQHPDEMDDKLDNVVQKLRKTKGYPPLFKAAFGSEEITSDKMLKAITQFVLSLVSANSKYDKYVRKEGNVTLTTDELDGMKLFESKGCKTCHAGELFTDGSFRNNGLSKFERTKVVYVDGKPTLQVVVDYGRYFVTQLETDRYKFKVPTLRNIAESLPYMHDGRFTKLQEVLDYYDAGVQDTPNLDPLLKQGGRLGIPMTADEKRKIIAFLNTLTDTEFLQDKRFAEPDGFPVR